MKQEAQKELQFWTVFLQVSQDYSALTTLAEGCTLHQN